VRVASAVVLPDRSGAAWAGSGYTGGPSPSRPRLLLADILTHPACCRMSPPPTLLDDLNIRCESQAPLAPHTWYGVGGPAHLLVHPSSVQQLAELASRCFEAGVEVYVLGSGANLLVADEGVDAVVVKLDDPSFRFVQQSGTHITAGAGFDLAKLVLQTAKDGLGGLSCLAGIPATVGGAVRMNAGGSFGEIGSSVRRVHVMDARGQVYYRDRDDLVFSYRRSNIVARYILSVEFELTEDDPAELVQQVKEIFFYKKTTQPLREDSAGCAFKNPDAEQVPSGLPASAGALIDRAGLKGYRVGGAEISKQHANFIVTYAGATSADVLALMDHAAETVLHEYGVVLQREVVTWP